MRELTDVERQRAADLASLPAATVGLFEVTATQIEKSIIDANESIRQALRDAGVHDYLAQPQGNKVVLPALFLANGQQRETQVSLYRPMTKEGDPRIWPYESKDSLTPGHVVAVVCSRDVIYFVDLLDPSFDDAVGLVSDELLYEGGPSAVALDLLERLRTLAAGGPIPSPRTGPTAIGAAVEAALGIIQNSAKTPDYMGIELKAKRKASIGTRSTLFARVADWKLSACRSSAEILDRFGYDRDGLRRLYCQINAGYANSLGLRFRVDHENGRLEEEHHGELGVRPVATWLIDGLKASLAAKHAETFWISARSVEIEGQEHFQLLNVEHTESPHVAAFPFLIDDDIVTMDHLIKRSASGKVSEKGPLFKIMPAHLNRLFPVLRKYELR